VRIRDEVCDGVGVGMVGFGGFEEVGGRVEGVRSLGAWPRKRQG
jgi:hypothetical protein